LREGQVTASNFKCFRFSLALGSMPDYIASTDLGKKLEKKPFNIQKQHRSGMPFEEENQ